MDLSGHSHRRPPRRNDDRIILHFDLDCFYAQVVENQQPALKKLPLGIRQKGILATCNYVARKRGVGKLTTLAEAKRLCPDLVVVDGEDLSPFRDVSKRLYSLLRSHSWNGRVERLGLDEVFLDVTDMVKYNLELLNQSTITNSYFYLSRTDPAGGGFPYDASSFAGCVHAPEDLAKAAHGGHDGYLDHPLYMRLLVASHLAHYLRMKIEEEGYTSACGIATNKLLAKLVGNKNKPRNQTTLLGLSPEIVHAFIDEHNLRKIPGIGGKTTRLLEAFIHERDIDPDPHTLESTLTAGQVRTHPAIQPPSVLENILGGPGSERGLVGKIWSLLHGVDDSEVKAARDIPTQISIEDTYRGLNEPSEIRRELHLITASLLRRILIDLVEDDASQTQTQTSPPPTTTTRKWLAHPKTLRLTTRPYTPPAEAKPYDWSRTSKSVPLPRFVFNLAATSLDQTAQRLVSETLMPLFQRMNPAPRGWNTGLINVCVTNMAGSEGGGGARNIGDMFRKQKGVRREFTAYADEGQSSPERGQETTGKRPRDAESADGEPEWQDDDDDEPWDPVVLDDGPTGRTDGETCPRCGYWMPLFVVGSHLRFHEMEEAEGGG
ncbi:hypothetical protein QBC39DRAFT_304241 [Podospora conica]|nr:hypothetical protein QBC39DRAFT_304241 [Schizothecium conicum]